MLDGMEQAGSRQPLRDAGMMTQPGATCDEEWYRELGAAGGADQFLAHVLEAALRGGYPVMAGVRRVVANVLLMAALEVGDPVATLVHVKADNFFGDAGRRGCRRLHNAILPCLAGEFVGSW